MTTKRKKEKRRKKRKKERKRAHVYARIKGKKLRTSKLKSLAFSAFRLSFRVILSPPSSNFKKSILCRCDICKAINPVFIFESKSGRKCMAIISKYFHTVSVIPSHQSQAIGKSLSFVVAGVLVGLPNVAYLAFFVAFLYLLHRFCSVCSCHCSNTFLFYFVKGLAFPFLYYYYSIIYLYSQAVLQCF